VIVLLKAIMKDLPMMRATAMVNPVETGSIHLTVMEILPAEPTPGAILTTPENDIHPTSVLQKG
jgi:hypothetical protein